jgi:hypothetical protein
MKKIKKFLAVFMALVILLSASGLQSYAADMTVTDNISELNISELDAMITELDGLVTQCQSRGMNCSYETVKIAVLKRYEKFLTEDKANNYTEQLTFTINSLNRLYDQAKANLQGYLNGTITPLNAPQYLTSERKVVGGSIYANTTQGERPVYFVGYGHFGTVANDIPVLNDLGASIIQNEIGPNSVIVPRGQGSHAGLTDDDQFDISTAAIYSRIVPMLQNAQNNNVCVSLLISPHYFPSFLYALYPDLKFDESGSFLGYHINHPVARRVIEVYLRTLIPIIKDYSSLFDICLTNEPDYESSASAYDFPQWQAYLKDKYASVSDLNQKLGTSFGSFEEIQMPPDTERSALANEWVQFNNELFSGWHKWMTEIIKECAPNIPVDAKVMSYMSYNETSAWRGTDYNQFSKFCDFNGCDTWSSIDNTNFKMFFKTAWYDYMGDIKNAPIINSEDHIIGDRSQYYTDAENKLLTSFVGADIWQGAIHGRDASTIWTWERSFDHSSDFYGSILARPECIASVGETALDLNRLSFEVQAFDNTKEDVAILFSDSSRVYDSVYSNFVLLATEGASCAGKSVKFVTEDTIGSLANGYLLIIPNCTAVKTSTLSAVNNYAKAGNKVLLLSKCMDRDENGKLQNAELLKETYSNCTIYGTNLIWTLVQAFSNAVTKIINIFKPFSFDMTKGIFDYLSHNRNAMTFLLAPPFVDLTPMAMRNKILQMSPNNVMLVNGIFKTTVMGAEWRVTEYNGKLLVNVCNYSNSAIKNVSLVYKGKTLRTMDELIKQKQVKNNFTLEPYTPMLFSIDK